MTCEEVRREEMVEKYVTDQLAPEVLDSFEQHYFECAQCFSLLQTYRDLQLELAQSRNSLQTVSKPSWVWRWAWVPALAVVVLGVSVTLFQSSTPAPQEP